MSTHRWILALCTALFLGGCENRGADLADHINRIMTDKINAGEIRNREQTETAFLEVKHQAAKELGINRDNQITQEEKDALDIGIKKYEKEWETLIQEKWGDTKE